MNSLVYLLLLVSIIGFATSARLNIDDMDYKSLISLLSEYDEEEDYSDELSPVINTVSHGGKAPKYHVQRAQDLQSDGNTLEISITKPTAVSLSPTSEVFQLIDAFIQLKKELVWRMWALINDNMDLFKQIYNLIISKITKLHSFTLVGINVFRKIIDFALQMFSMWNVAKPVALGLHSFIKK